MLLKMELGTATPVLPLIRWNRRFVALPVHTSPTGSTATKRTLTPATRTYAVMHSSSAVDTPPLLSALPVFGHNSAAAA